MEQKKKIRIAIIVLAVLLGLSLLALGGTLLRSRPNDVPASATVPDNLITPEDSPAAKPDESASPAQDGSAAQTPGGTTAQPVQSQTTEPKKAATIQLYSKQPQENTPFQVCNMFPGDSETKYFRVQVSYHDQVTVHYRATVRPGYEKLAEVLMVRVKLLTTGETLYDGLMASMPESVTHQLSAQGSATDELYYEITAYLDTSVGNEYQNKDLIADFKWWVEETGNLDNTPGTGDTSRLLPWAALAACSGGAMLLLLVGRKRREEEEHV